MKTTLLGPHVEIRPFDESLITDAYLGWLQDKELLRYSKQRLRTHTRASCRAYLQSFVDSPHHFGSIHQRGDGVPVGTITAYVERHDGVADLGILVGHPQARGKGLAREAWGLMMEYLFRFEDLRKVTGGTLAVNQPMVRIFLHWRMALEGVKREEQVVDGRPADVLLFGALKSEWLRYFPEPLAQR